VFVLSVQIFSHFSRNTALKYSATKETLACENTNKVSHVIHHFFPEVKFQSRTAFERLDRECINTIFTRSAPINTLMDTRESGQESKTDAQQINFMSIAAALSANFLNFTSLYFLYCFY
jgi:hypothetical protein